MTKTATKLSIIFSSDLKHIDKTAEETKLFLAGLGKKDHTFTILLIIREALINATIHGNRCDAQKKVTFEIEYQNNKFVIQVIDNGPGFDYEKIFKKQQDTSLESGRGLFIMKTYASKVNYNKKGNHLTIEMLIDKQTT